MKHMATIGQAGSGEKSLFVPFFAIYAANPDISAKNKYP
jgi:hypothetical protein